MTIEDVKGLREELEEHAEAKVEITPDTVVPEEGALYWDVEDRELRVDEVDLLDPQGSQVKGEVRSKGERDYRPYSTTLAIWQRVWHDKAPLAKRGKGWVG